MAKAKRIKGLNCETRAAQGIALVLRAKLDEMCAQRDAALDFSDIEGVHGMRVSSRRLRSALRDFKPYLSRKISPKSLRHVAHALGAVRDEDVAIVMLEKLGAEAHDEIKAGIEILIGERRQRRKEARAALKKTLSKTALKELRENFRSELQRATEESGKKKAGDETNSAEVIRFHNVGGEIISARFRELEGMSRSLHRPFDIEPLHRMRIAAKSLRYSIELHTQCWGEQLIPFAKEVGGLQELLGDLHDCDVWIAEFGKRLDHLQQDDASSVKSGQSHSPEQRAALWLLQHFTTDRTRHFNNALALWDKWVVTGLPKQLADTLDEVRGSLESQSTGTNTKPPAAIG